MSNTTRWYDLWVNSMPIGQFFKAFLGVYSYGKRIPADLMHMSEALTTALLRGLFSADGYTSGNSLGIVLSNRTLATQVHQLLLRLGYLFSIKENTHRLGRVPAYRISATANECGPLFSALFDRTAPPFSKDVKQYIEHDDLRWVRIDDIAVEDYGGMVMDIEVAEDHSFVSAGVVVSNCYVVPSPRDSRRGIIDTLSQMTEIMSRGGGVGINISSLRPRHSYVKGVNGRSSGAVSWGALYSFVTGLIEQGGCFGPNERILTDKGLLPASELADRMDAGEAFMAHTHQGLRAITHRFRNGIKPLYEVTTRRGYKVQITAEHKVSVLMDGQITTMPLKYLVEGDEILLLLGEGVQAEAVPLKPLNYQRPPMSTTLNDEVTLPDVLHEDLAWLVGYMHGDGYVQWGKKVNWSAPKAIKLAMADAYPGILEQAVETIRRTFAVEPVIRQGDGALKEVALYSRLVVEWLIANGLLKAKAEDIRVPEAIFRSPSSVQAAFIAGYFDADGCNRGGKSGYGLDSISRPMLADVQQLLALNGIVSRIGVTDRSEQGWRTIYRLTVTGRRFRERFAAFVPTAKRSLTDNGVREENTYPAEAWTALGARAKYRQRIYDGVSERISFAQLERIGERLTDAGQTAAAEQISDLLHTIPDRISSIELVGDSEVFDFEVDDVHLLSANGIYTSNSRRGALMLILDDWHPDVFDFINSKRTAGKITNANISVGVSDRLMEAVKADADWELMFPDTHAPNYDADWDGNLEQWIVNGGATQVYRTVKAREVWNAIIESAWTSAEPGVFFRERYNKESNSWYFAPIIATNPCVTGDTRISTANGLVTARELFDSEAPVEVVLDSRFGQQQATSQSSRMFRTGVKPVFRLQTKEGYFLRATADHRVMTTQGWVELGHLKPGDSLHILNRKGGFGAQGSLEEGRVLGWVIGDGAVKSDTAVLSFFGTEKRELAAQFAGYVDAMVAPLTSTARSYHVGVVDVPARDEARVESTRLRTIVAQHGLDTAKHQVPEAVFQGSEEMQRGFLQALFTADGGFQDGGDKGGTVRLASNHTTLLESVQQILANFGIASRIYRDRRKAGYRELPDSNREPHAYWCEAQHELAISKRNLNVFAREVGFLMPYKQDALMKYIERGPRGTYSESFTGTVESVMADGVEEVFDLTAPLTHSFAANTLVVHNCGEQGLPGFGVCNLGAINLAKFYDEARNDVAWDDLDRAVRYATRFLDDVIDSTPYFFDENRQQQLGERRVGLNNMGLAELLIRLGVRYGSDESVALIDKLYGFIARASYETSVELAAEKGAFPQFNAEKFLQSGFMQSMPDDVRQKVRQHGIRNVTLLTQAPTGTTGTMVNTSTGIEPFFSWVYYRKSRLGLHEEQVALVQEWHEANPGQSELPDYFVTAMDLSPTEHVRVQAAIQRWVDSSISKTANLPNNYTIEQTRELYEYMYELGCKGGTVYRDGSRDEQVLMLKGDERAEDEMAALKKDEPAAAVEQMVTPYHVYPRPKKLSGVTTNMRTPYGTAYITMNSDDHGNPFEVFITAPGKAGSDLQADAEGLGRMISLQLRTTAPQNRKQMLKLVIDQLKDIGGARSFGMGPNRVLSLPDAVAGALLDHFFPEEKAQQLSLFGGGYEVGPAEADDVQDLAPAVEPEPAPPPPAAPLNGHAAAQNGHSSSNGKAGNGHYTPAGAIRGAEMCPSCQTVSLVRVDACRKCLSCGYSEC